MNFPKSEIAWRAVVLLLLSLLSAGALAAPDFALPGVSVQIGNAPGSGAQTASAVKIVLALTLLALAPGIVIATTSFTRIVVVFAMLRHALGLQDTPPNTVLVSLALFLTLFIMSPVIERIDTEALQPLSKNQISASEAIQRGAAPLKEFMLRQTREQDLALMAEIANQPPPASVEEVRFVQLAPAFMLSELKSAFQIGFVIFLPFLVIDLVVSSVLMAMGMMMVPPVVISLPFKILLFVMIDGWNLIVRALAGSFY
ncbi:MAG: flagellar type III secretion system pore protein FliP [Rhodocyclaceae bacterium]